MSRRTTNSAVARALEAQQREFLTRSLARNDVELAALIDLHRSLHSVKDAIIRICGEGTLLDLGEGNLELAQGDSLRVAKDSKAELPAHEGQPLCVDFLLRMKLRRKLLNRLARRLLRVAHALDGNDVQPPGPPRYGDLRLHVDEKSVATFAEHWKQQEEAIRKIEAARESYVYKEAKTEVKVEEKQEEETKSETPPPTEEEKQQEPTVKSNDDSAAASEDTKTDDKPPHAVVSSEALPSAAGLAEMEDPLEGCYDVLRDYKDAYTKLVDPESGAVQYPEHTQEEDFQSIRAGIGAVHPNMNAKEKEAEFKRWRAALWARIPDQPTFAELGMKNRVFDLEQRRKRALEIHDDDEEEEEEKHEEEEGDEDDKSEEDKDDDESTSKSSKSSNEDDAMDVDKGEEDKQSTEGEEDKEETAKADKRATVDTSGESEENDEDGDVEMEDAGEQEEEEDTESKKEHQKEDGDKPKKEAELEEEKEVQNPADDEAEGPKDTKKSSRSEEESPSKEKAESKAEAELDALPVRVKPISLIPVPSFYEQDLKRIKLIHAEMMGTSIQDDARRRLEEATREYNAALARSNQYYDRHVAIKQQMIDHHARMARLKADYDVQVAVARNQYLKKRQSFEHNKLNKLLPSRNNRPRTGTRGTQAYMARDPVSSYVADSLADVIDAVDNIAQGMVQNEVFTEKFIPPPLSAVGQQFSNELALSNEAQTVNMKLRASEEKRHQCWKKMLKVKLEFEAPRMPAARATPQYGTTVPPLRATTPQILPRMAARPTVPSYTPASYKATPVPQTPASVSSSKYSAARVRQRISADGTVAPASEPKRTKEGLYQRPAGRSRKSMDWDPVRGIWVPASRST